MQQLSLRVAEGEIYAFLGLNGAGKTTTIRMLLGMIKPTTGEAHVLGTRVRPGQPRALGGGRLPGRNAARLPRADRPGEPGSGPASPSGHGTGKPSSRAIERLGLAEYADRRAGVLSQGNAQRLGLAKALLHDPKLILLDEPANGLDPAGIVEIRELLLELTREQGVTVFMSSHILAEVSRLADRIGIIHDGRLLQEMDVDELERNRRRRLLVRTRDLPAAREKLSTAGYPGEIGPGRSPGARAGRGDRTPGEHRHAAGAGQTPPTLSGGGRRGTGSLFPPPGRSERRVEMKTLSSMIWIELRKALRSRVPLFTAIGSLFMPLGIGFLLFVSMNPEISRQMGLISTKATLLADTAANWAAYLGLFAQVLALGGFMLTAMIAVWVFGREFSDATLKDLLAVPVRRASILLAKFLVVAIWAAALGALILGLGLLLGVFFRLPGGSADVIWSGLVHVGISVCLGIIAGLPFAFFASLGRGYLLPVGALMLTMIVCTTGHCGRLGRVLPLGHPGCVCTGGSPGPGQFRDPGPGEPGRDWRHALVVALG